MSREAGRVYALPRLTRPGITGALGLSIFLGGCSATNPPSFSAGSLTHSEPASLLQAMSNDEKGFHEKATAEQDHELFGAGRDGSALYYSLCSSKQTKVLLGCIGFVGAFLTVSDHQPGLFAQHLSLASDDGADISERQILTAFRTAHRDYRARSRAIAQIISSHAQWLANNADAPDAEGMQLRRQIAELQLRQINIYLAFIESDYRLADVAAKLRRTKLVEQQARSFSERLNTLKTSLLQSVDDLNALFPSIQVLSEDT